MRRFSLLLTTVCLLILLSTTISYGFDFSELTDAVEERTLDNGMKFIVLPRHDAPVASFLVWADVGAADDPKGLTGLAHCLEHLAFKGTREIGTREYKQEVKLLAIEDSLYEELRAEQFKGHLADSARLAELQKASEEARDAAFDLVVPNEFSEIFDQEGGNGQNAGTSYDFTMYYVNLPSNKMELWMAMESERFVNPVFREMYKERDVVAEERRLRTESDPFGRMMEEFFALAYKAHPYANKIGGHMSDIHNYTRKAVEEQFQKYYGPSNLTAVVVGDVDPDEVFKMAKKYFGRIPERPKPDPVATVEPEQLGERRMMMEDPSQPMLWIGWHVPDGLHPDIPAIDAMMDHLGQGRTSALYKNLIKEKKIAIQAQSWAGWPGNKYASMAMCLAFPAQGHDNYECEEQIYVEIERLKSELIAPEALEGIKARAKSGLINILVSNSGLAQQLAGYQVSWGDWRALFNELDRINAVTAEDIKRVANEYFTEKNRTVVFVNTEES